MPLSVAQGGTGGTSPATVRQKLGIEDLLAGKAGLTETTLALAGKANTQDVNTALNLKVSTSTLSNLLTTKADLDGGGKLLASQLPALAITDTFPVNSQAAMLALVAQRGDIAVRSDAASPFVMYILTTDDPSQLSSWLGIALPADVVKSVAGLAGPTITKAALVAALGVLALDGNGVLNLASPPKITTAHIDRNGICNPENAGADTTGTSDSNVAFQVCLDLLEARGGTFQVPLGQCRITQDLQYQSAGPGFKMQGHGYGSRIIQNGPDGGKLFDFRPNPGVFLRGMVLEDFYIECRNKEGRAFEFVSNRSMYIRNVGGEPTDESYYWGNVYRFIACLESRMDGGNWKNALGSEGTAGTNGAYVRGNLYNFMNTVLNFAIHKPLAVGFACCSFGDTATSPGVEGVSFVDPYFVAVGRGFDMRNQGDIYGGVNSPYGAPASLRVKGGHVHSFQDCVRVRQGSCNIISDMLLFRDHTHGQAGSHVFAGRQHNIQLSNLQLRTVGNGTYPNQGAPPIIIVSGDYADVSNVNGLSVGNVPSNNSCSARFANFNNVKFAGGGGGLTGNGWDVTAADSMLNQVRLVTAY